MIAYKLVSLDWESFMLSTVSAKSRATDYILQYRLGRVTRARLSSLGVMCFDTIKHAEEFIQNSEDLPKAVLVEVEGIGEPSYPAGVAYGICDEGLYEFYHPDAALYRPPCHQPPLGTVCFKSVMSMRVIQSKCDRLRLFGIPSGSRA